MIPSRADGTHITDDDNDDDLFVDDPSELVGRDVNFFIKVPVCRGLPRSIYKVGFPSMHIMIQKQLWHIFYGLTGSLVSVQILFGS